MLVGCACSEKELECPLTTGDPSRCWGYGELGKRFLNASGLVSDNGTLIPTSPLAIRWGGRLNAAAEIVRAPVGICVLSDVDDLVMGEPVVLSPRGNSGGV